jgi:hypothetical protein
LDTETIRELLHRQPFEPFEIVMSSGEVHRVVHPEFAIVSPSRVVVVDPVTDKLAILSRVHITEVRTPQAA